MSKAMDMSSQGGGQLYMQTNEVRNAIVHYRWSKRGTLTEVERVVTGGAGSGTFKPISGQESAPNAFEGAGSVILSPDRGFLFTTNGGDNSVSSFSVDKNGRLTLVSVKPTGNAVEGKSGTAKSLAYLPSKGMLFVLHSFGPDHLRLMSVDDEGNLKPRQERYTANTKKIRPTVCPPWPYSRPTGSSLLSAPCLTGQSHTQGSIQTAHRFSGFSGAAVLSTRSPRMRQISMASPSFTCRSVTVKVVVSM